MMFYFRAIVFFIAALVLGISQVNFSFAGDEPKPVDPTQKKKADLPPFPLPVKLLGYITKNGTSVALLDIDGQKLTMRQGEKKPFRLANQEIVVWFESPIDFDNRSFKLGFPSSFYHVDCRLGVEVSPSNSAER